MKLLNAVLKPESFRILELLLPSIRWRLCDWRYRSVSCSANLVAKLTSPSLTSCGPLWHLMLASSQGVSICGRSVSFQAHWCPTGEEAAVWAINSGHLTLCFLSMGNCMLCALQRTDHSNLLPFAISTFATNMLLYAFVFVCHCMPSIAIWQGSWMQLEDKIESHPIVDIECRTRTHNVMIQRSNHVDFTFNFCDSVTLAGKQLDWSRAYRNRIQPSEPTSTAIYIPAAWTWRSWEFFFLWCFPGFHFIDRCLMILVPFWSY